MEKFQMTNLAWLWAPGAHEAATAVCTPDRQCITGTGTAYVSGASPEIPLPTYIEPSTYKELPPTHHPRNYGRPAWQPNQATRALMQQFTQGEEELETTALFKKGG